jgi:hypothetical protein
VLAVVAKHRDESIQNADITVVAGDTQQQIQEEPILTFDASIEQIAGIIASFGTYLHFAALF